MHTELFPVFFGHSVLRYCCIHNWALCFSRGCLLWHMWRTQYSV